MSSDRARVSYDERRQWRSVVFQAGRVALEADGNEASQLAAEELRGETLEVVGARGTPDDGYKVIEPRDDSGPPFDFTVGKGTMYVGGVRVHAYNDIIYSQQSEWLDYSGSPDWHDPATSAGKNELIGLVLREQEVGAVEDASLVDVALGGPDTCQRTRLNQRIVRIGTEASTCNDAIKDVQKHWNGWRWDPESSRLLTACGLKVSFPAQVGAADPCQPQAAAGYLKPDNQLIRIKVVDFNAAAGTGHLVWGYDDASFLYRVQTTDGQTLKLAPIPIDEFHQPRANQAVEALRATARLVTGWDLGADWNHGPSEVSANDYVAASDGTVALLTSDYEPTTQSVTVPLLPADYRDQTKTPALFMRVWEERVAFAVGTPTALGDTGIQATIVSLGQNGSVAVGASWALAARPSTPTKVYPERYLDQPQPPDVPRQWLCPLAVVHWDEGLLRVLEDCRNTFDDLVDLSNRFPANPTTWNRVAEISWRNDWPLTLDRFNQGIAVTTATPVDPNSVSENSVLLFLDLTIGTVFSDFRFPLEVRGVLQTAGTSFTFVPKPSVSPTQLQAWLGAQTQAELKSLIPITVGIRCRLVLKGNSILDGQGNPLDGNVFGIVKQRDGHTYTDLRLPYSGEGIKGGDFESWFFLSLPPQVKSISPQPSQVLQHADAVEVTFSRAMDASTITPASFTVTSSESGPVSGIVTNVSSTVATFRPTDAGGNPKSFAGPNIGASVTYSVGLDGSVVKDTYGILLDGTGGGAPGTDYSGTFKLVIGTGVASVSPADGGTMLFVGSQKVVITFTQPVDPATVNTITFKVLNQTNVTPVTGTVSLDPTNTVATFAGPFVPAIYKVVLTGVNDVNGLPISAVCNGVTGNTFCSLFTKVDKPPKESGKDSKDGQKDGKDTKDDKEGDKMGAEKMGAEKTHKDTDGLFRPSGGEVSRDPDILERPAENVAPEARLFITPDERPDVGREVLRDSEE